MRGVPFSSPLIQSDWQTKIVIPGKFYTPRSLRIPSSGTLGRSQVHLNPLPFWPPSQARIVGLSKREDHDRSLEGPCSVISVRMCVSASGAVVLLTANLAFPVRCTNTLSMNDGFRKSFKKWTGQSGFFPPFARKCIRQGNYYHRKNAPSIATMFQLLLDATPAKSKWNFLDWTITRAKNGNEILISSNAADTKGRIGAVRLAFRFACGVAAFLLCNKPWHKSQHERVYIVLSITNARTSNNPPELREYVHSRSLNIWKL